MPTSLTETLPISTVHEPDSVDELRALVQQAANEQLAVYPIGGGTSLNYGLPARRNGIGVSTAQLNQIIDYPAEDMTITVGAGITISELTATLAQNRQRLPIDVPQSDQATLGGVIATNWSGPRRYGCGTMRDHVIGIEAVDARGELFKGGGRVVKNVAGYDFCRLLTGSMGTLGIISQVTLKLMPMVAEYCIVACDIRNWKHAEQLLASLVNSETTPSAIELVAGPEWDSLVNERATLLVGLEGTAIEVAWMRETIAAEWAKLDTQVARFFEGAEATHLWSRLTEAPALPDSALTLKCTTVPSAVTTFASSALELAPSCNLQSHAGDGVTILRFGKFPAEGLGRTLLSQLAPLANRFGGNVTILSNPSGAEMTKQSVWGGIDAPFELMSLIKRQFDPDNILNPDRFVYA